MFAGLTGKGLRYLKCFIHKLHPPRSSASLVHQNSSDPQPQHLIAHLLRPGTITLALLPSLHITLDGRALLLGEVSITTTLVPYLRSAGFALGLDSLPLRVSEPSPSRVVYPNLLTPSTHPELNLEVRTRPSVQHLTPADTTPARFPSETPSRCT